MFDPDKDANATATFLAELVTGTGDDPYGGADPVEYTDWSPVFRDVEVFYEPAGSTYVTRETGDHVAREERVFAPLEIGQAVDVDDLNQGVRIGEGDRIVLSHYGATHEWRIDSFRARTLDGHGTLDHGEGYVHLGLEDLGD